jgi:hypothetical protein
MDGTADGTSTGVPRHHHIAANTDLQSFCGTDVAAGHHNLTSPGSRAD